MHYNLLTYPYFFISLYQLRKIPYLYVPIFYPVFINNPGNEFYFNHAVGAKPYNNSNHVLGVQFPNINLFSVQFGNCNSNSCTIFVKYSNNVVTQFNINPTQTTVSQQTFSLQSIEGRFRAKLTPNKSGSRLCVNVCIEQYNQNINRWVKIASDNCINECTNI
ncbi:hypothetical protein [Tepidibacter aestuarii]|uniref:hypothetical protein n=1 Tax=Tepidibacter aestuarii TaxID=2925782 RepID=UPI0020BFFC9E|nr:hypothetical protein [Tepidibacter aestuarii]CAH2213157.1 protein of unknown function [Tepidibacter aestuarii]